MSVTDEFLTANAAYAGSFTKGDLPMPPAAKRRFWSAWMPASIRQRRSDLEEGDAHVIRNAGGRASDDAMRSLIISNELLGTREFVLIHHTDCGMLTFTNDQLREKIHDELGVDASAIDFLPFSDVAQSVRDDLATIRTSPLMPKDIPVRGFIYDVTTGALTEVV